MSSNFKFYLNDEECEEYRDRVGLAEPVTAAAEYTFAVMHAESPATRKRKSIAEAKKTESDRKRKVLAKKKKSLPKPPKKPKPPVPQNEDGYPLKFCTYEPEEGRQVYRPPGYGDDSDPYQIHCCDCHLTPCIAKGINNDIGRQHMFKYYFDNKVLIEVAQQETSTFLHKKYCKVMKRRYSKNLVPPPCIMQACEEHGNCLEATVGNSDGDSDFDCDFYRVTCHALSTVAERRKERAERRRKERARESEYSSDEEEEFNMNDLLYDAAAKKKKERELQVQPKVPPPKEVAAPALSFSEKLADMDYLLNCNSDEDETREEYDDRMAKKRRDSVHTTPAAKVMDLLLNSRSDKEENVFEYRERMAKKCKEEYSTSDSKPAAKVNYQELLVSSYSDEETESPGHGYSSTMASKAASKVESLESDEEYEF